MKNGYFIDPSTGGKSAGRLCAVLCAFAAVGLAFVLVLKGHATEGVTVICAVLIATWGEYTANSTARVIVTKGALGTPVPASSPGSDPHMEEPVG